MTQPAVPVAMTDLSYLIMVADQDTPSAVASNAGRIVGIPLGYVPFLGSGPDNTGTLLGVNGYPRAAILPTTPAGVTEFLMTPALDNTTKTAIDSIPLPGIWKDATAKQTYQNAARQLIRTFNVPAATVRTALQNLYTAAVTNDRTP